MSLGQTTDKGPRGANPLVTAESFIDEDYDPAAGRPRKKQKLAASAFQQAKEEDEKIQVLEEKYLLEFKNQLLLEMVSVAQLDAKKNLENLEREKLKTEALKWELANLNMEHSQGIVED